MIHFNCPTCEKSYRVEDRYAGQSTHCKQCGETIRVPAGVTGRDADSIPAPRVAATVAVPVGPVPQAQRPSTSGAKNMGLAALVLGSIALLASWVPLVGCISLPFAGIGLLLAIIGGIMALTSNGRGIAFPIAGGGVCLLSIGVVIVVSVLVIKRAGNELADIVDTAVYEQAADRLELLRDRVSELEAQVAGFEQSAPMLGKLVVNDRSIVWGDWAGQERLVVTIEVTNNLDQTVYGADFQGEIIRAGVDDPWVDAEVSFYEKEGLPPGETATWVARPERHGPWGQTPRDRDDLVLYLTPLRLKDRQYNSIFPGPLYSGDSQSLEEYRLEIAELEQQVRDYEDAR